MNAEEKMENFQLDSGDQENVELVLTNNDSTDLSTNTNHNSSKFFQ